jgi:D-glycero-alpha-D-manno-heptose-7-phosphate kinase
VIVATAPVRVCDAGGWTDTWFAGRGAVCNLAVRPGVRVELHPADELVIDADGGPSPLVVVALEEAGVHAGRVVVRSAVPPGSSLGTSAAVAVAVLAAAGVPRSALARRAHAVEVERLGLQSGVQDQAAASSGGASWLEIDYPAARRSAIAVPPAAWRSLDARFVTVFLGEHRSSAVHERVIADLTDDASALDELRACAVAARDALAAGDLRAYGVALARNTEAQRALHPALVSAAADEVIAVARRAGALGWKVNGAGGEGGSVTVVCGDVVPALPGRVLPLRLARRGVVVSGGGARGRPSPPR